MPFERIHTMEQVHAAVEAVRKAKLKNLSLDLIYGLPDQTMERWQENLAAAVALDPEHPELLWTEGGGGNPALCGPGNCWPSGG